MGGETLPFPPELEAVGFERDVGPFPRTTLDDGVAATIAHFEAERGNAASARLKRRERHADRRHRVASGCPGGRRSRRAPGVAASGGARSARTRRLRLPLGVGSGRAGALPLARPARVGDQRAEPGTPARRHRAVRRLGSRVERGNEEPDRTTRACARGGSSAAGVAVDGLDGPVVFVCAEFGIHPSLPIYSGGLGVLAGDILKQASDPALPMIGVGLLYRGLLPAARRPHRPPARVLDADPARAAADRRRSSTRPGRRCG